MNTVVANSSNILDRNLKLYNQNILPIKDMLNIRDLFIPSKENEIIIEIFNNDPSNNPAALEENIAYNKIKQDYELISGERFNIEQEDGLIYLNHPRWSLMGVGETLYEAYANLFLEAKSLLKSFKNLPVETLSPDALDLRDFLFQIA